MAFNIQRFPSGFVLVDRQSKQQGEADVDPDFSIASLLSGLSITKKNSANPDLLLQVGLTMRKYFGKEINNWVKDQMEHARTDSTHWNFFIEFIQVLAGEDRQLRGWRNVMSRALVGDIISFSEYVSRRDSGRRFDQKTTISKVRELEWNSETTTSEMLINLGDIDMALFSLVVFYGQENDLLSNIENERKSIWFGAHRKL